MCLGVPGLVVTRQDVPGELPAAVVEFAGIRRPVCVACVPEARPGDYVLVHAGLAIAVVDEVEAMRVVNYLREMGETDGWADAPAGETPSP